MSFQKFILLFFSLGISLISIAQDVHFSQFTSAPWNVNPGYTGINSSDIRLVNSYRSQWGSVTKSYTTMATYADLAMMKGKWRKNFIGLGGGFMKDMAGDGELATTTMGGAFNYIFGISEGNDQFLSIGTQFNLVQRTINFQKFSWDNQWDGEAYNAGLPSRELFNNGNTSFMDFSTGVIWFNRINSSTKINIGSAVYHLTSPNQAFFGEDKLYRRIVVHANAVMNAKGKNTVHPSLLVTSQGPNLEVILGGSYRGIMQEPARYSGSTKEVAMSFGGYWRLRDALIAVVKLDYKNFEIGMSYDINISGLAVASTLRGGPEISVAYLGSFQSMKRSGSNKNVRAL